MYVTVHSEFKAAFQGYAIIPFGMPRFDSTGVGFLTVSDTIRQLYTNKKSFEYRLKTLSQVLGVLLLGFEIIPIHFRKVLINCRK